MSSSLCLWKGWMNRLKIKLILLSLLVGLALFPTITWGQESPSFTLALSAPAPSVKQDVRITVKGNQLQDVYGYEIRLQYDSSRLRFKSASANWTGLSVPATDENGIVTFAHTKLGDSLGEKGTANIVTFAFEAIAEGTAIVKLERVKLVDSKVAAITLSPDTQTKININLHSQNAAFNDIKSHWAEADIKYALELGFVNGYPDGTFRPNSKVTRAEFTAMLTRAVTLPPSSGENTDITLDFIDLVLIPQWAKPYIAEAASAGIISGYEDQTFRSSNLITRAEMTLMIARTAGFDLNQNKNSSFADENSIPSWAKTAVADSVTEGLINGRSNNRFAPLEHATRSEALTVILKLRTLLQ